MLSVTLMNCNSKKKIDLLSLTLKEDFLKLIVVKKDRSKFSLDKIHPSTGLPLLQTTNINWFKFGNTELKHNPYDGSIQSIGFYLEKAYNTKDSLFPIAGYSITIPQDDEVFKALKNKYGTPKEISPKPVIKETLAERRGRLGLKNEGMPKRTAKDSLLDGFHSFLWKFKDITIIYCESYNPRKRHVDLDGNPIQNKKWEQKITSSVYIVRNTPMDLTNSGKTAAERLIQIFTP